MSDFRIGDVVRCIDDGGYIEIGHVARIRHIDEEGWLHLFDHEGEDRMRPPKEFELASQGDLNSNPDTETMRDRFAMAALTGLVASGKYIHAKSTASISYEIADAMMEARK